MKSTWLFTLVALSSACQCGRGVLDRVDSELAVEPARLDFGDVTVHTQAVKTLTLSNRSRLAIMLTSVAIRSDSSPGFSVEAGEASVPAGGSVTVAVTFAPPVEGEASGTLRI